MVGNRKGRKGDRARLAIVPEIGYIATLAASMGSSMALESAKATS